MSHSYPSDISREQFARDDMPRGVGPTRCGPSPAPWTTFSAEPCAVPLEKRVSGANAGIFWRTLACLFPAMERAASGQDSIPSPGPAQHCPKNRLARSQSNGRADQLRYVDCVTRTPPGGL